MKQGKKGFTLIELLIVVVIIGILAAIAIPKFAATKERAYVATMKTDLKNLATAEEGYASASNGNYFAKTLDNQAGTLVADTSSGSFVPSAGVKVITTVTAGPPAGWQATASSKFTNQTCTIWVNQIGTATGPEAAPQCK